MRHRSTWIALSLLTLVLVGAGAGAAGTTFSVSTNISSDATLSGSVVWTGSPSAAASKVQFSIDGALKWTEYVSPYQYNGDPAGVLDTTTLSNGTHTLLVTAYATNGQTATKSKSVTVSNSSNTPKPFTVSSSIASGSTLTGSVTWTAAPNGATASKVDFLVDGALKSTDSASPYQFNGDPNGALDTTALSNGTHTLAVTAYATDGRTASASSTVTVSNSTGQTPFTATSSVVNGATLTGSLVWTATASGGTVSKVLYLIDGTQKWQENYSPYQFNGDPSGLLDTSTLSDGTHTLAVTAYATDGRTASASSTVTVNNSTGQSQFTVTDSVANGATLSGSVTWTAAPNGATASKVDFLVDGALKSTDSASPYQFNGDPNGALDTTTLSNGTHTLAVTAYATDGRTAAASSTVTVSNSSPAPSLGTIPRYGFTVTGKSLARSQADQAFELDQIQAAANGHRALVKIDSVPNNQNALDAWAKLAEARNLEPMFTMFSVTGPIDPQTAANFATVEGTRWKGRVRLFELCNEPDLHGWTPEQYTAVLKAAYVALKAANPDAIMVAGALWKWDGGPTANATGGVREWVRRMYAAGAKGYFDMLSLHLYDDPDNHGTWNLWDQAFTMSPSVRSIMDANGDQSVPIVSTETGGPVYKYGEAGQATIIDHDFNHAYSGQVRFMLVYTMMNDTTPGFGVLRDDRSRRPAWYTFQQRAT